MEKKGSVHSVGSFECQPTVFKMYLVGSGEYLKVFEQIRMVSVHNSCFRGAHEPLKCAQTWCAWAYFRGEGPEFHELQDFHESKTLAVV